MDRLITLKMKTNNETPKSKAETAKYNDPKNIDELNTQIISISKAVTNGDIDKKTAASKITKINQIHRKAIRALVESTKNGNKELPDFWKSKEKPDIEREKAFLKGQVEMQKILELQIRYKKLIKKGGTRISFLEQ